MPATWAGLSALDLCLHRTSVVNDGPLEGQSPWEFASNALPGVACFISCCAMPAPRAGPQAHPCCSTPILVGLAGFNEGGPGWGAVELVRGWTAPTSPPDPGALLDRYTASHQGTSAAMAHIQAAAQAAALELIVSVLPGMALILLLRALAGSTSVPHGLLCRY